MKMIIAVISPTKVNTVREALVKIEVERMTVCDAQEFYSDKGQMPPAIYQGFTGSNILRRMVLEVVVNDDFLDRTIATIRRALEHGAEIQRNECEIYILPMNQIVQLDHATRGPTAV